MKSPLRKLMLTSHIALSVGWLGAVTGFVALDITALSSQSSRIVLSSYIAMNTLGWYVILPFCLGSLITGVVQSLCTPWGLLKHYWIAAKFFLTIGSTVLLLVHLRLISNGAIIALKEQVPNSDLQDIGSELLQKSVLALIVLITTTVISVYKPWGKINFRKTNQVGVMENKGSKKLSGLKILIGASILLILFLIISHLAGKMPHH